VLSVSTGTRGRSVLLEHHAEFAGGGIVNSTLDPNSFPTDRANAMNTQVKVDEGLTLPIPQHWKRAAVVAYSSGDDPERGVSVVVRRESLDARVKLTQYADNALVELARTMPEFTLIERHPCMLDHEPAVELRYTLKVRGVDYYQRQLYALDIPGSVLSITSTVPTEHVDEHTEFFDSLARDARLIEPGKNNDPGGPSV